MRIIMRDPNMVERLSCALAAILAQPKETAATESHEQLGYAAKSSRCNGQSMAALRVLSYGDGGIVGRSS
jgi:hypothetical protein